MQQPVVEQDAVGQPGQLIVRRQIFQLRGALLHHLFQVLAIP
jgi:hypothetical protein